MPLGQHVEGRATSSGLDSPVRTKVAISHHDTIKWFEVGRTAAALKGNTGELQKELEAMRVALSTGDLDGCAEHDVNFHKAILQSSGNRNLLRVWEALVFDVRIRISISKVSKDLAEVVESHQPIVDALRNGRAREASLLLRNHVETCAEYLKKSDSDFGGSQSVPEGYGERERRSASLFSTSKLFDSLSVL
jgi:hypothetical protein